MPVATIAAAAAVVAGAATQRLTGLGFALLSAPFLVLVLGPREGVLVANALGALTSAMVLARAWSRVDWTRVLRLLPGSLVAVPLGFMVVRAFPEPVLLTTVGIICTVAVLTAWSGASWPWLGSRPGSAASGFLSGFFSVTAGTGGPPLTVYATSARWSPSVFSASVQVILLANGCLALAIKGMPSDLSLLGWSAVAVVAGVTVGSRLAARIPAAAALRLVLALALAGSVAAAARGIAAIA
jgi:uncharacterized membrane protein YfcA